jgi:haloacetate dehalogenase
VTKNRSVDRPLGLDNWHRYFLAQLYALPEDLLGANPASCYFHSGCKRFKPDALADYLRCVHRPHTIHAMCEDYRAGASFTELGHAGAWVTQ